MDDSFYQETDTLDSVTVAYKYKNRFWHALPFLCFLVVLAAFACFCAAIFFAWFYGYDEEVYKAFATPSDSLEIWGFSALLSGCLVLITFLTALRMATEYNITFNSSGISGTYNNFYLSGIDFVETVTVRGRHGYIEYYLCDIERVDGINYISWENFKSFSRYDDFIVLWRDDVPPNGLATKFFMMFDSGFLFNRKEFPLKIYGSRSDLADLQDLLSRRFSQSRPVCSGVKRLI